MRPAWIWVRRAVTRLTVGRQAGFRIIAFAPDVAERPDALDAFVAHVKRTHGLLSPQEAADHLAGGAADRARRLPCLLTFDGGISSSVQGMLDRHGARAVFFVCPGLMAFTGANQRAVIAANLFDGRIKPRDLPPDLRLMTWDEAAEKVGKVEWFASSFGDAGSISAEALAIIGGRFRFCRSTVAGVNSPVTPRLALRADAINLDAPPGEAPAGEAKLAMEGGLDGVGHDARRALDAAASIDARGAGQ